MRLLARLVTVSLFILSIASCAAKTPIKLAGDIVKIKPEQLSEYWVAANPSFKISVPLVKKGYVKYRYIIDSNGAIFNPEVIESKPDGVVNKAGLIALTKLAFIPSESNPNRTPVQVETEIRFE